MMTLSTHVNHDPAELAKFSQLAHRWWDPESEFKPLHDLNPHRLSWIGKWGSLSDKQVLDVGCGGGILSESMARLGARVHGIDLAEKPLGVARLHALDSGVPVTYQCISVEDLALAQPHQYDVVTCMEMLEHVPDPASVVQACARLIKPEGFVFFSTLNRNLKSYLFAILGAEYLLRLLPRGTHDHGRFIKPSELSRWARHAHLTVEEIEGVHYHPLTRQYRLGPEPSVNYLMACRVTSW
ncbi:bifunctional 2-polyprenyl-6-hydroxyphenol methylase/3-demethylubiquinol 3-O-methyltransferase UbiG [Ferrovum sp.]|uniref:bifunctional 2-polyprenyl-6-hydroxyphenol methylase/3-demethylubiquinol 3-O-methyltransferase UbiG n=1 Tax=Ferrovum sp. TaxID=2609467 RepID=UPI0026116E78|nr:bifunctional 2-polyprenyl-6-hydroxyphenol methylase/3-demethylubiquinol 3-O-methyltransferase UbiG [Ferrovum sp.]